MTLAAFTNFINMLKDIGKHEYDKQRNRRHLKDSNETSRDEKYLKKINITQD